MTLAPLRWPDAADAAIRGDLTVAAAYVTPAGGTVVTSVSPVGLGDREAGIVGFTTSLGFPKKLERILRDPHVALAYHTREHGFAADNAYVLAQGRASVELSPSPQRLAELMRASEPFLGATKRGPLWDWLLREYHQERVFVDVPLERVTVWEDLAAREAHNVTGAAWPPMPDAQKPPRNGTGPRVDVAALARQIDKLPHRLLAYQGKDAFPVIVPVRITRHDETGLHLDVPRGLLPPGGRQSRFPRPHLRAAVRRAGHANADRLAQRHRRRHRCLRPPYIQRTVGSSVPHSPDGLQRSAGQVRGVACAAGWHSGPPARSRRPLTCPSAVRSGPQ